MQSSAMQLFILFLLVGWSGCASIKPPPEVVRRPLPVLPPRPPVVSEAEIGTPDTYEGAARVIDHLARQIELWEAWGLAVLELLKE